MPEKLKLPARVYSQDRQPVLLTCRKAVYLPIDFMDNKTNAAITAVGASLIQYQFPNAALKWQHRRNVGLLKPELKKPRYF